MCMWPPLFLWLTIIGRGGLGSLSSTAVKYLNSEYMYNDGLNKWIELREDGH